MELVMFGAHVMRCITSPILAVPGLRHLMGSGWLGTKHLSTIEFSGYWSYPPTLEFPEGCINYPTGHLFRMICFSLLQTSFGNKCISDTHCFVLPDLDFWEVLCLILLVFWEGFLFRCFVFPFNSPLHRSRRDFFHTWFYLSHLYRISS